MIKTEKVPWGLEWRMVDKVKAASWWPAARPAKVRLTLGSCEQHQFDVSATSLPVSVKVGGQPGNPLSKHPATVDCLPG